MPAPQAGRAAVEVVGDVANFGARLERDLNKETRGVKVDMRSTANSVSRGVQAGTDAAKGHLRSLGGTAKSTFSGMGRDADAAGTKISEGIGKGTEQPRDELGRFIKRGAAAGGGFALGFGGVTKVLGGIGKLAGGALSLGIKAAAVASAANTAAGLVVALAPAVGAVGALAPAFIAAKIAAGVFQLSMMGVQDAIGAGLTGDTEAFNEALKKMPVSAQNVMKEIVGLKDQLNGVRQVVQGNFFGYLQGQIAPLGKTYLPMVANQLGVMATGFSKAIASSAEFLRMPSSVQAVSNALGSTGQAVNNVSAGLPGLIRAFLPLWEVGSSFLPGLTSGFDGLTQRVGAFMEKAQETGQLHEFISGGLSVLGELGQVLGDVGSILGSVFQAASAAGGDLLGVIGEAVGQFAAFLNTAEGMSALTSIFQVLGQVSGIFGQALAMVLPILGQLVSALAGALMPVLPVIAGLIQQLGPVLSQVATMLSSLLGPAISVVVGLMTALVPVIMPIVQALMGALMPVITALAPVITALGQVISTILGAALQALMPLFTALLPVISQLLVSVLTPLVPILGLIGELFLALMPALTPLIQLAAQLITIGLIPLSKIIPIVAAVLQFLITALIAIIGPVARVIGVVAQFLAKLLTAPNVIAVVTAVWNALKTATVAVFTFIGRMIVAQWNLIKAVSSAVWSFIKSHITTQINIVKVVLNSIGAVISRVIGFFNRARAGAASALSAMRSNVSSAVSAVIGFFGRLVSSATGKINSLIGVVRSIGGRIRSAIGNLGSLLVGAGRAVIQGLINGITQKLGALRDKAASAASTIRNLFPFSPAKEGPLSGRGSPEIAGGKIADMIAGGLERQIPAVRRAALSVADASRLSARSLDFGGHGILRAAWAGAQPTAALPAAGGEGRSIVFGAGAVVVNFHGPVTPDQAYQAGQAAGRGLAAAFAARDVRTTVRTI